MKMFFRLWFWWLFLTLLYYFLAVPLGLLFEDHLSGDLTRFLGLLVPFGVFNFLGAVNMGVRGLITFAIFLVVILSGDFVLDRYGLDGLKRVGVSLIILFLLTMIVDFMLTGDFEWLKLFLAGHGVRF